MSWEKIVDNPSNKAPSSKWQGKVYKSIGDSITWQDGKAYPSTSNIAKGYQTIMNQLISFSQILNTGVSGASMARNSNYPTYGSNVISETNVSVNYSTVDMVTIFAGTNDFHLEVPMGNKGQIGDVTFDDTTFYGAYRKLIEHILTQKPTIRIYLFTPLQRDGLGRDVNYVNLHGHKLIDYVNAVKSIGEMYSLPVLDLYSQSGITKLTLSAYTRDGLHPIDVGYAKIGEIATNFVNLH